MIFRAEVLNAFFEGLFVRVTQGLEVNCKMLKALIVEIQTLKSLISISEHYLVFLL